VIWPDPASQEYGVFLSIDEAKVHLIPPIVFLCLAVSRNKKIEVRRLTDPPYSVYPLTRSTITALVSRRSSLFLRKFLGEVCTRACLYEDLGSPLLPIYSPSHHCFSCFSNRLLPPPWETDEALSRSANYYSSARQGRSFPFPRIIHLLMTSYCFPPLSSLPLMCAFF